MADKLRLGFQGLPHIGIETPFRDVTIDRDFRILVFLPQNSSISLLHFGGFPGCIYMVKRDQSALNIGARA